MDERINDRAQGKPTLAANRPFGHAMTKRAQQVTVPVHDHTPVPAPPRSIPVQGSDANMGSTDLTIERAGEDEAIA